MTFEDACRKYRPHLLKVARRLCSHVPVDAEDAVQEALVRAWQHWDDRAGNEWPWLYLMLRQSIHRMLTRVRADKRGGKFVHCDFLPAVHARPVEPSQEPAIHLAEVIDRFRVLGPAQAQSLKLIAKGYSTSEIAEETGRSVAAVSMSLTLGRRRLQQIFNTEGL